MTWLRNVIVRLGLARRPDAGSSRREAKQERTIRKADRVLADFARQDGALRIVVGKKP